MKFKLLETKTVLVVALVAGLAVGVLGVFSIHYPTAQAGAKHVFPENQYGQTYGSQLDAPSPDTLPDLIVATGVNGVNGYIKRTDDDQLNTLEDAKALAKKYSEHPTREIPVYAVDGKAVVDKFIIGGGSSKEFKTAEEMKKYDEENHISTE